MLRKRVIFQHLPWHVYISDQTGISSSTPPPISSSYTRVALPPLPPPHPLCRRQTYCKQSSAMHQCASGQQPRRTSPICLPAYHTSASTMPSPCCKGQTDTAASPLNPFLPPDTAVQALYIQLQLPLDVMQASRCHAGRLEGKHTWVMRYGRTRDVTRMTSHAWRHTHDVTRMTSHAWRNIGVTSHLGRARSYIGFE